ncbi:MAG: SUMF1/EgtB/PvdO family nonheme iron enzyme [Spirochaetia bacterium]|nr:SUMF1/EgtB/PvdO family nonheme iron enzyme [Spirochaetia bacterium]
MKKLISLLFTAFISFSLFAQTAVADKNLGKTLEKNKDAAAVFVSEIDLSKMQIIESGTVTIPLLAKSKIKIVSGMDMTGISSRLTYSNLKKWNTTFEVKDLDSKTYAITNIAGIETIAQYKERKIEEQKAEARKNLTKYPVQVVNQEVINLGASETAWLPGQIQDKLKSNLQEYLGLKTVVDSKSEAVLKKLQAESESAARDESTAIELGKITTAKFALFTKIRKTGSGYTISVDFTDLTTGEQMASATSKEYSKAEYLYGSTGAVDEVTLSIANKLGLSISELNKNLLTSGSAGFSVDDQLALAKQNEAQFQKQMADYDAELSKLMTSNDINAIQNKNRIEAEKALLVEKQNAERKRQEELRAQKLRADQDAKLEAERSIALKTQRDQMAKDAAAKAAEVRKLKLEKQGVLGQISVLESKKKALVEIRQDVENRSLELYNQLVKERAAEEERIRNKSYSTVELGSDGNPTEQALKRRENQIIKSYEDLTNKFFTDCDTVKQATMSQQNGLLTEIRGDQKTLANTKTVSSMGDELKVSFGTYEGSKNGWNAYLSLYSDGILLYTDNFIVNYEALSGKKAPNMETELNDAVIEEYTNNVDMYNSLLTRGDPIIYFEVDYNVTSENDDKPSQYKFNFSKIRVINTVSGKVTQTSALSKVQSRTMKPENDLREIVGITSYEKALLKEFKRNVNLMPLPEAIKLQRWFENSIQQGLQLSKAFSSYVLLENKTRILQMSVKIPNTKFTMLKTEVTQSLYQDVMGENPSRIIGENYPVECVSWYDAIYFCNKLSLLCGLTPVYSVNGKTNPDKWGYTPHQISRIEGKITQDLTANGFRLPTVEEWQYAAKGGQNYTYSGSNYLDEVGWCNSNSGDRTHPVAQKKANGYGLYDMSGNVWEWCWDVHPYRSDNRYYCGGSYYNSGSNCKVGNRYYYYGASNQYNDLGFRIVCSASN